jgi:hypothetical protein
MCDYPRVLLVTLIAAGLLVPVSAAAQIDEAAPRTHWGAPDLQGVWSYATLTPLQRPAALADREFYTAEEATTRDSAVTVDSPPRAGDVGTYNALWFDRGQVLTDRRTSLIVDPPNGRLPIRTDAAAWVESEVEYRNAHSDDSWIHRTNWDRCLTYHGVPPISTGYNNTYQIFQTPDHVAILVENIHDVRVIPLDDRPVLHDDIRQWNGDSRGYWEGDTLVVETANYSDATEHRFPSSRHTRAVERFTRVSEDVIDYQFTVEDSTVYAQPWTVVRPMPRLDNYVIYEYACHEGNYAMSNILSGGRALETSGSGGDAR